MFRTRVAGVVAAVVAAIVLGPAGTASAQTETLKDGMRLATESLESGRARNALERLVAVSNEAPAE